MNENIKNKTVKKILCYNILKNGVCSYKNCMFAHSINEQVLTSVKQEIYDIIKNNNNLENINLLENDLYKNLVIMCKECKKCIDFKCSGGLNCNNGVCLKQYKLCYKDLTYGNCCNDLFTDSKNNNIKSCIYGIHLTEKKLIPYGTQYLNKKYGLKYIKKIKLTDDNLYNVINEINNEN